jgi:hypothetical protein
MSGLKMKGAVMSPFDRYVSLGRDCEVGFQLKRVRGAQESGFFNWNFTEPEALLSLLKSNFFGILQENNLSIHLDGALVRDSSHGFFVHHDFDIKSFKSAPDFPKKLKRLQDKFTYFVDTFRKGAQSPGRTAYFFKCEIPDARDAALAIRAELGRYHEQNSFSLIVVQTSDRAEVDWGISAIHNRYLKRFSPHDETLDAHVPSWDNIFREFPHRIPLRLASQ